MDLIRYPDDARPASWKTPVLALGNFDGLHRGHMKIIERVRRTAEERGATPVVLTFDPHPTRVVRPDRALRVLMSEAQKVEVLASAGVRGVAIVRFTAEMSRWEPERFVRLVLVEWLGVSEVWVGGNFLFGRDRSGTFAVLRSLGERHGFRADKIDPVSVRDDVVSSTRIRRLLAGGSVDEAGVLLGRHFYIDGEVVAGDARGRALGFPTANLRTGNEMVPANGVYATIARTADGFQPAVTNIGVRPTFDGGGAASIETHLLRGGRDLYGAHLRLYFVQRLRDEQAFVSADALKARIDEDCREARALFGQLSV
ncbi:MAG: bifunctional riboflavin kinase/FAD synthetase [Vicinamibacterales bacterium]|nr:bifunctional riboflavin kinase/FAD synthetase [Vicinamibacterales bacterium]